MTWAQRYYGVNDYSTIDINSTGTAPTWNLKSKILDNGNQSGTFYRLAAGALNNNTDRLIVATDGSRVLFTERSINADWTGLSIDPEDIIELDVPGGAGGVELLVNGVSQGFKRAGSNVRISLMILGENNNTYLGADVEYFNFVTSDDGTLDRLYDATASSHAAGTPVLSDISGNTQDATGVNMPTAGLVGAGGVWLDLGGSGISIGVDSTLPNLSSSLSLSKIDNSFSIDINSILPSLSSSLSLANTDGAFDLSISSELPSLTSILSLSVVNPGNNAGVNSFLPSLVSSLSLTKADPEAGLLINSLLPSLISSLSLTNIDPSFDFAASSTLPSLSSSLSLYNGVLGISVGDRNNINIVVKSTNINVITKSRNIEEY